MLRRLTVLAVATAALALIGSPPASARPVIEQPDLSGTLLDQQLRSAVHGFAPWLLPR